MCLGKVGPEVSYSRRRALCALRPCWSSKLVSAPVPTATGQFAELYPRFHDVPYVFIGTNEII